MKISTKGRYGTRALLELAMRDSNEPMLLRNIAKKQDISLAYLEHVISPLIAGGILRSTKGPKGGISLNRKPSDIKLSDVIRLLEGSVAPADCVDNPDICERSVTCVTRDVWCELKDAMDNILDSTTIQNMVDRQNEKGLPHADLETILE
ncbi:MAG: Rrf2 family transcriptional regulator [Dehalococcoidales bacterium]|nr:MAG: Rrf2 family transcriptional regulator [Dehalococcoidales bacterium]